jgi:hypothetical protein
MSWRERAAVPGRVGKYLADELQAIYGSPGGVRLAAADVVVPAQPVDGARPGLSLFSTA